MMIDFTTNTFIERRRVSHVRTTENTAVATARRCLDHPRHRRTALAGGPPAGRGLDLDRRYRRRGGNHPSCRLVAADSPQLLVKGAMR